MYIICNKLPANIDTSITIDPNIMHIEPYTEKYLISIFRKDNKGNVKLNDTKGLLESDFDEIMKIAKEYIAIDDVYMITINKYGK
jgi:hypothetical protein